MTSDFAQETSVVDARPSLQGEPSPELGPGMAYRARSQAVLGQRWSPSGLVGAVGRASVGFGLAVGRSRAIRPTVRFDDLNSAALRPSFELWRMRRSGADGGEAPLDASPRLDASVRGPGDPAIVRRSAPLVAARRRLAAARSARPSWTDQIIERSSIGFVAPAPGGPMPEPAAPAGFVPSGDAKLDRLRLLVADRDGDARRDAPAGAGATRSDSIPLRRSTAPRPTVATSHDASVPGRLARSLRPEPVDPGIVPAARVGGNGAPASTDSHRPDRRPASTPGSPRSGSTGGRRGSSGRPSRRAEPDRMELLRAALVERGLLSGDGPEAGSAPAEAGVDGGYSNDATRSDPMSGSPRPIGDRVQRSPRDGSPGGDLHRGDASVVTQTSDPRRTAVDAPAPARESSSVEPTVEARVARSGVTTGNLDVAPLTRSESVRAVRLQRLIRTGLAGTDTASPDDRVLGGIDPVGLDSSSDDGVPRPGAVVSPTLGRTARTVAAASAVDSSADAPPAAIARSAFELERPVVPALVRPGDTEAATVIRRVTLPRTLSRHHRPPSTFTERTAPTVGSERLGGIGEADAPSVSAVGSLITRAVPRPSVVTLAEIAMFPPMARTRSGVPASEPGDALRPMRSVVPPGTGALLDVVRRSERPDPSRRGPSPALAPTTRSDVHPNHLLAPRARNDARDEVGTTLRRSSSDPGTVAAPPIASRAVAPPSAPPARGADAPSDHIDLGHDRTPIARSAGEPEVPLAPAEQVAEQFMTALSETVRRRPAPLPTTFRPMADAIAGPRPVMLSTDPASRRALRSVGKVAATTGDTIHLDERAIPAARLAEVMAHELTHVAHPSPAPRFFDDIDDSPEERRAEEVAKVMARSPLAPAASLVAPTGRSGDSVLRRSPASTIARSSTSTARPSSPGSVSADQLAAQITGSRSNPSAERSGDVIRRSLTDASPRSTSSASSVIRRSGEQTSEPGYAGSQSAAAMTDAEFLTYFRDNLSEVMGLIEDRMIIELERRGGRTWGRL